MKCDIHLDPVEFRIPFAQIGIRDVSPSAANLRKCVPVWENTDSASTPGREVEIRSVSRWKILFVPNPRPTVFETSLPPTVAGLAGQLFGYKKSRG